MPQESFNPKDPEQAAANNPHERKQPKISPPEEGKVSSPAEKEEPKPAQRIAELRTQLAEAMAAHPEVALAEQKARAVADLESVYYSLMTQPYSIESMRYWELQLENALYRLESLIGSEQAQKELQRVKDENAPRWGTEPNIRYDGRWDKIKDIVVTRFKDWFDLE